MSVGKNWDRFTLIPGSELSIVLMVLGGCLFECQLIGEKIISATSCCVDILQSVSAYSFFFSGDQLGDEIMQV